MNLKAQLILGYNEVFRVDPPEDRLAFIKRFSKKHIIGEFAGINYWIKPMKSLGFDKSLSFQRRTLAYFTAIHKQLALFYITRFESFVSGDSTYPIIFNRACLLFALEEILNCTEMIDRDDFVMAKPEVWDNLLRYILAVNSEITKLRIPEDEPLTFEKLNANMLVLNEFDVAVDQFLTPYRGLQLLSFLNFNPKYALYLKEYFEEKVKCDPENFIYQIIGAYISRKNENPELEFVIYIENEVNIFEYLSNQKILSKEPLKVLTLKKAPFYKNIDQNGRLRYVVLDFTFLLEKSYNFLINDFWFDFLKNEKGLNHYDEYRGELGLFFQNYVKFWLKRIVGYDKSCFIKLFLELTIQKAGGDFEFCDVYIRRNHEIIIGEVKFSALYDKEKYSENLIGFYKNDRERFYSDFGVNQVVESLKNLQQYLMQVDPEAQAVEQYTIYPVLIVNENSFQTPLAAQIFNDRFQELIGSLNIGMFNIMPLTLVHISDLERIEPYVDVANADLIWELFKYHVSNQKLIMPFYQTLNQKLKGRKYPKVLLEEISRLSLKFNPEQIDPRSRLSQG
jgi:hypothetical protein